MSNQLCLTSSRCILHKIVSSIVIRTKMEWRRQEFELGGARRACSLNSGRNHKNFDTNITNWKTEMTRCTTATVSLWLERDVYYQSATAHWIYNNVSRNCQIGVRKLQGHVPQRPVAGNDNAEVCRDANCLCTVC